MQFISNSMQETKALARQMGKLAPAGTIIALNGEMGAGKTHFCQGLAKGLGIERHIVSPTFTLINEYEGRMPFYHMDMYRLCEEDEFFDLGLEEYFTAPGLTAIEWAQNLGSFLPATCVQIDFVLGEKEDSRILQITCAEKDRAWIEEAIKNANFGY